MIKVWGNEYLGDIIAVDTETTLAPFHMTPDLITFQACGQGPDEYLVRKSDVKRFMMRHYESDLIFHNAPFDVDVIEQHTSSRGLLFDWYDRDKVWDTAVMWQLLHLASIGFVPFKRSLDYLADRFLNIKVDKDDAIRKNFGQFKDAKIEDIPDEFKEYAAKDSRVTFNLYWVLRSKMVEYDKMGTWLSHHIQVKGDLALKRIHKRGIGFDLAARDEWLSGMLDKMEPVKDRLATWGWVRGLKGLQDRYESIVTMLGIADKLPRTEDGQISSKGEDLDPFRGITFVDDYLTFHEMEKAISFVKDLSSSRIHPNYNLLMNTGRTSCSKPNFQQLPRMGGIREMFKAKKGHTFIITDYSAIELATLSQVLLKQQGYSKMAEKINEGKDLHKYYASVYRKCDEDQVSKEWRQQAKAPNFGFAGGLGVQTFIQFSRGYGLELTESEAQDMKNAWYGAYPEVVPYMQGENGYVYTLTGRRRANTSYCAEKNTPFQGLASDGAKLALYQLEKAGVNVVGFVHDEIISEAPVSKSAEILTRQERVMIDSMRQVVPDVLVQVESQISEVYTK